MLLSYQSIFFLRRQPYIVLNFLYFYLQLLKTFGNIRMMLAQCRKPQLVPQQSDPPQLSD